MRRYSAHLGYMFNEHPLEDRFAAARAAGFREIEHPGPYPIPASRLAKLCLQNGLSFVQMALPSGNAARGEKGIACLPGREAEFRDGVAEGLAYAREISSRFVHVMSGLKPADIPEEEAWSVYVGNLRYACREAAAVDMPVLVEPIGSATIADYLIDHPRLALKAMDEVAAPNLSMLFDAFHATNAGVDAIEFVHEHHARISHVHIADHPGRHEPGTGAFDFRALFDVLHRAGYVGVVGLEYIPAGDTLAGLRWRDTY